MTIEAHLSAIWSLEKLDDLPFTTGSMDETFKIWNVSNFDCIRTIANGRHNQAICLKSLPLNRLASGSLEMITIWNTENGTRMQTLNCEDGWIRCIIYLPNERLASCFGNN